LVLVTANAKHFVSTEKDDSNNKALLKRYYKSQPGYVKGSVTAPGESIIKKYYNDYLEGENDGSIIESLGGGRRLTIININKSETYNGEKGVDENDNVPKPETLLSFVYYMEKGNYRYTQSKGDLQKASDLMEK